MERSAQGRRYRRVTLIEGGIGAEREISLQSGANIKAALVRLGYELTVLDADDALPAALMRDRPEVAFIALHGRYGEDGCVQGLLEWLRIPYTGSGVLSSALAMDKVSAKRIFACEGIPVPAGICWPKQCILDGLAAALAKAHLDFPLFVKPRSLGSSVSAMRVDTMPELEAAVEDAFAQDDDALIETLVSGKEVAVALFNNRALGSVEVEMQSAFYDFETKYRAKNVYHVPARISPAAQAAISTYAEKAAAALMVRGASRADFYVDKDDRIHLFEINTLPGMTEASLLPKVAGRHGWDFDTLCDRILNAARLDYCNKSE